MRINLRHNAKLLCWKIICLKHGLESKFTRELKGHLVIFGDHFHPQKLKARKKFILKNSTATIYSK